MATIQQRGERYTATIRRKGHKSLSKTFSTRKRAETWARRTETKIEDGEIFETSNRTLHEAIERYREACGAKLKTFDHTVLNRWDAELGELTLRHLRRSHFFASRDVPFDLRHLGGPLLYELPEKADRDASSRDSASSCDEYAHSGVTAWRDGLYGSVTLSLC